MTVKIRENGKPMRRKSLALDPTRIPRTKLAKLKKNKKQHKKSKLRINEVFSMWIGLFNGELPIEICKSGIIKEKQEINLKRFASLSLALRDAELMNKKKDKN